MPDTALTRPRGDAARAALVESAERLMAERGIEAVSLRDVSAAAGQRNHSAAQYHFGDRMGLVAGIYESRMLRVDARRHEYLDALAAVDRSTEVRGLVEAIVVPLLDVVAELDGWYARFLARSRWEPAAWNVLLGLPTSGSFTRAFLALDGALAEAVPSVRARRHRLDQLMTLVVGTLAGWEGAPDRGEARLGRDTLAAELVSTGVALLTTPTEPVVPLEGAQP